jgi:hypothetical protein
MLYLWLTKQIRFVWPVLILSLIVGSVLLLLTHALSARPV